MQDVNPRSSRRGGCHECSLSLSVATGSLLTSLQNQEVSASHWRAAHLFGVVLECLLTAQFKRHLRGAACWPQCMCHFLLSTSAGHLHPSAGHLHPSAMSVHILQVMLQMLQHSQLQQQQQWQQQQQHDCTNLLQLQPQGQQPAAAAKRMEIYERRDVCRRRRKLAELVVEEHGSPVTDNE